MVQQYWWNSSGGTEMWNCNGGTVVVEKSYGGTVMVER